MKAIILFFGDPNSSEEKKLSFIQQICSIKDAEKCILSPGNDIAFILEGGGKEIPIVTAAPKIKFIIYGHDDPNEVNYKKLSRLFWKLAKKQQKAKKEE